ncbi:MAG: alpha/beta hydrolase [Dehalococcoidia bacterium]|nr:alpha/beta hydrolase [Dehalococcoidia bacterium]
MPITLINGNRTYYEVHGKGEPLIMIQGFTGTAQAWGLQVRSFKQHFKTIIFDNRGIGRSDCPKEPFSIETMAADVTGLMDHLYIEKASILGLSMGGLIAQEIAIAHPARVKKLILCSTFSTRYVPETVAGANTETISWQEQPHAEIRDLDLNTMMTSVVSSAYNSTVYRILFLLLLKINKRSIRSQGIYGQAEAVNKHSTLERLHLIKSPTLVMTGAADRLVSPLHSDILAARIPNAKLVKIAGGSHAFFFEMAGKFNKEVISFLNNDRASYN